MKLVCNLSSFSILDKIASYVDGILIEDEKDIIQKINTIDSYGLISIYKLNEMVFPLELEAYRKKILLTKDTHCLYYITDLGLAHILKELGLIERTIFDPVTMITNSLDAKEFIEYGFHSIGLSNEITLNDVEQIISKTSCKAFMQVFGYRLMLSTRRALISLYQEKINTDFLKEKLWIQEATRTDSFPIVETDKGTKIYRSQIICHLNEMNTLPLEYAYLDSFRIDEPTFIEVLKLFNALKNGKNKEEVMSLLSSMKLPIGEGFSYKDSVYMKEEF
ncbi:MAG: U32 family peptidase [Anaeroplasma bactoclasticum]|nr:U32 family peptidase [Anaeroplasma bactoclasticum]MCM1556664.1 U32 family peptidase [Anaeroplasma bactoclasticum]